MTTRSQIFEPHMVISAIATPAGRGGVAIVRMSGEGALDVGKAMFSRKGEISPNRMYAGEIDCGAFTDFGFLVYFKAPASFTGEDVVELHLHGGTQIARGALERTLALGARLAERGEFTKRAFLNGKLSLSAAEGMVDMINAASQAEVRAGYRLYREKLAREGKELQEILLGAIARLEADMDFPEEDLDVSRPEIFAALERVKTRLAALIESSKTGKKIKDGVNVAICGAPNAGKSTLFNALLGYDRAIVSEIAGTTRDTLEDVLEIEGVLFRLIDTAGLREGKDDLEREGIRRAEAAVGGADLILYLREPDSDATPPPFPEDVPVLFVGTKCDIKRDGNADLFVSAKTGEGLELLKRSIYQHGFGREDDGAFLMETRHISAIRLALGYVESAQKGAEAGIPADVYAEDVRAAWRALGLITGETASERVVDEIFQKFCVGK